MKQGGLTLVELLVTVAISAVLVVALGTAHHAAVRYQLDRQSASSQASRIETFEARLRGLLERAYLSDDDSDPLTYFVASATGGSLAELDTLTFTALAEPPRAAYLRATAPHDELNSRFRPQGGTVEVGIGPTVVGDGAAGGTLLRLQQPPDGDPTQGGRQSTLAAEAEILGFEFYDGTAWQTVWDTQSGPRRLPAAVTVRYRWQQQAGERVVTCRLLHSDVTPANPVLQEGGA